MRLSALLLCLPLASTAAAQTFEDQIRAEVTRYVVTINRGDPQAVAALYLNDARTSSAGDGQIYRGWHRIADLFREVYSRAGSIEMTVDSVAVLPLGSDAALAVMRYRWVLGRMNSQPVAGAMTLLYTRTPQGWRDRRGHPTRNAPRLPALFWHRTQSAAEISPSSFWPS